MYIGDIEITKREVLFSTLIIAAMIAIGVPISDVISTNASEDYVKLATSVRVTKSDQFDYIRRTNVGNFIAEGLLISNDTLTNSELPGIYSRIEKITEEYTEHVGVETYTDSKGDVKTRTYTYYEWDVVNREVTSSRSFTFLGKVFTPVSINYSMDSDNHTKYFKLKSDVRYHYRTTCITVYGILTGRTEGRTYNNLDFERGNTIDNKLNQLESNVDTYPILFWICWIVLTIGLLVGFYAFENRWLED